MFESTVLLLLDAVCIIHLSQAKCTPYKTLNFLPVKAVVLPNLERSHSNSNGGKFRSGTVWFLVVMEPFIITHPLSCSNKNIVLTLNIGLDKGGWGIR